MTLRDVEKMLSTLIANSKYGPRILYTKDGVYTRHDDGRVTFEPYTSSA